MRFPGARILIFAKAPQPGRVKTRLIPVLGPRGAADLHARLLRGVVTKLASADLAALELWCAPVTGFDLFAELARGCGVSLYRQEGRGLGERMLHGVCDALSRGQRIVLVGSDCPALDGDYLARALKALETCDAALGPAEDGGYVLLGLKRAEPVLFRGMAWGGDRVAALTRSRMASLGWNWVELPTLWDVDRPGDLIRLEASLSAEG